MTLKEHIDDIRANLEKGLFTNEAAVSTGIVLRLLDALAWPRFNPQVIAPEYSVEGGRVDYALCHPPSKPRVFIEAKQVGNIKGAEEQLLRYAFQRGVPIAVLTDGREWQFFYPMGEGTWAERKVCELDIITGDSRENAETLNRYLNYESIRTGEAIEAIKADYEKVVQQRQVATRLPEAWSKLLEEADEFLLHAVAEKTESLCEYRPTDEQVLNFLKSLERIESREKAAHFTATKTAEPKHERKGYFREDGSVEWNARGKRRVVSATIVAEMQRAYQESVVGEKGEVKYPMAILVKHGIVENTNYDKDGNWNAVAKIVGHPRQTKSDLEGVASSLTSKPLSNSLDQKPKVQSKAPPKLIVVTMPNGEVIKEYSGIGTFVKVIEKLIGEYGEEVVLRAADGRPIISTSPFNYPGKRDKRLGRFYISTNHGTDAKETYLDYIANRLGLGNKLRVDIVNKP